MDGEWRESSSGKTCGIKNPQTNETAFNVQACTPQEADAAYKGANAAQSEWAVTPLWKRAEMIKAAAQVLREHADEIGKVLTTEVAKQAQSAKSEVVRSAELMEYCAEEGVRYLGEGTLHQRARRAYVKGGTPHAQSPLPVPPM
jgi:glyceraldehyde-3-phosphate dehydrogenase (NADP+)